MENGRRSKMVTLLRSLALLQHRHHPPGDHACSEALGRLVQLYLQAAVQVGTSAKL